MRPSILLALVGLGCLTLGAFGNSASASDAKVRVLLFLSTDCPVAAKYTSRINALADKYSAKGVSFEALFPNDLETKPSVDAYMSERNYRFPFQIDLGAREARRLGVKVVPTAVVLGPSGDKLYRGPIDDNGDIALSRVSYLGDALASAIQGRRPALTVATGPGCVLMPSAKPPASGDVTYAANIMRIVETHCISCHRPGEVAPFSLVGYDNVRKWAPNIARVTTARQMPPWKALHGYGEFSYENMLSETEIETIRRWDAAGAPKGLLIRDMASPAAAPDWRLGNPDEILSPPTPYHLAAEGADVYRNFVVKNDSLEPRYVEAIDVRPGNRKVVHHVITFVDASGFANRLQQKCQDGEPGYTSSGGGPGFFPDTSFGGWVPGSVPRRAPEGVAFLLKPKSSIVIQVHYHKDGKPETDLTRVAIYFANSKPEKILNIAWLMNPAISIPANERTHAETLKYTLPSNMTWYGVMPHMHLLGRSMKADATLPDGSVKPLIYLKDWDFNWQLSYSFKSPMTLPKGTTINVRATFDNSAANPRNPNRPPKDVTWGEQTTDEMFLLVAAYTTDAKLH